MMRVLPEKRKIIVVLDGPGGYFYSHPLFSRTRINLKKLSINLKITTYYIADLPPSLTAIPFFSHSSIPIYFSIAIKSLPPPPSSSSPATPCVILLRMVRDLNFEKAIRSSTYGHPILLISYEEDMKIYLKFNERFRLFLWNPKLGPTSWLCARNLCALCFWGWRGLDGEVNGVSA